MRFREDLAKYPARKEEFAYVRFVLKGNPVSQVKTLLNVIDRGNIKYLDRDEELDMLKSSRHARVMNAVAEREFNPFNLILIAAVILAWWYLG